MLLPDPVGVLKMTLAPVTSSKSASCWAGYNGNAAQPSKRSSSSSGSMWDRPEMRWVRVIARNHALHAGEHLVEYSAKGLGVLKTAMVAREFDQRHSERFG